MEITSNLQLTFGLRWELALAPESTGEGPLAVTEASSLQRLSFAPAGSRLWEYFWKLCASDQYFFSTGE
jgi:hypothetical protein